MSFVMSLPIDDFVQLIAKAIEKQEESKAWDMWLTKYPNMTKDTYVPFKQFFQTQKQPISKRPKEDILKEAERIREAIKSRKG